MEDYTQIKTKALLRAIDVENIELIIQQLIEFKDISKNTRLNLDTDEKKVGTFLECLREPIREAYDMSVTTIRLEADDEVEGFIFLQQGHLDADDYQHQLAYMKRIFKTNKLNGDPVSVHQFSQRLRVIFFYAMPSAWQQKWKEKGGTPFSQTHIKKLI
jgi:hypothetical protein